MNDLGTEESSYIDNLNHQEKMIELKECELTLEKREVEILKKELELQKLEQDLRNMT